MKKGNFKRTKTEPGLHDSTFHSVATEPGLYAEFVKLALDDEKRELFDWDTASLTDARGTDVQGRETRADLKFTVDLKAGAAQFEVVMILEHKSYTDPELMMQMLRYQCSDYVRFGRPVLVIVVFQRGIGRYDGIQTFQQSLAWGNEEAKRILSRHFGKVLLDFGRFDLSLPKLIEDDVKMDAPVDLAVHTMANIFRFNRKILRAFFRKAQRVRGTAFHEVIMKMLIYIAKNYGGLEIEFMIEIEKQVVPDEELRVMPEYRDEYHTPQVARDAKKMAGPMAEKMAEEMAEEMVEEMVEEKVKCERERFARGLLDDGLSTDRIAELTELSREEVEEIRDGNSG